MTADAEQQRTAVGYSLVLPPGWRKLSLREPTAPELDEIVREAVAPLPEGVPQEVRAKFRALLDSQLTAAVERAARTPGCIDLYLPAGSSYGVPVPASFLVADVPAGKVPGLRRLARAAGDTGPLGPRTVDGVAGFRAERTVGADPATSFGLASRRVDYLFPVPGGTDRWLAVVFTTFGLRGPDDDVALLLTGLFDAMMENFRWEWERW